MNRKKERYEPGYKYIRDEKKVDMNQYVNDFSKLPLSLVYGFKEPECQISILNKLFNDCLESHASKRRVKLTRPIAPWMKDPTIVSDHQKLELSRIKSHDNKNPKEHQKYLEDKKQYKKTIKDKENSFFGKAVSSKNPKTVWSSIDHILIEAQNLCNINQSGFGKGHSINTLLLKLRHCIRTAMKRNEVTLSILIDYSKAFDTTDHRILLEKLQNMNFAKNTIKIICIYLIERYQYVQIEDKRSTLIPILFGVPQGSILGSVLLNLYVAELADGHIPKPSSTLMTLFCIDIARSQRFMNVYFRSKKMWKNCYLGHNKTI